jgi:hypothetical protein
MIEEGFIARLAALVPKPRVNLTRFHGIIAPDSKYRARVKPAKRGGGGQRAATGDGEEPTLAERRGSMTWAQRLKRVFGIDLDFDAAGRLYVADKYTRTTKIIAPDGALIQVLGSAQAGQGPGLFYLREGVEIRGRDVWFSYTCNDCIVRYRMFDQPRS